MVKTFRKKSTAKRFVKKKKGSQSMYKTKKGWKVKNKRR